MKLNILLLCNKPKARQDAATIVDHIEAFEKYSKHTIWLCSNLGDLPPLLDLTQFDAVIIHYSLCLFTDSYISRASKAKLREFTGLKIVFIQDEYRRINKIIEEFAFLKIDVLFTCFPEHEMGRIYTENALPGVSKYTNLTGYIPEYLIKQSQSIPIDKRSIHVGYRGRKIPFWLGALAYEKYDIVNKWNTFTRDENLITNISCQEHDRIYGSKWVDFLSSCKATLGVESGASVMDFTGELEQIIELHQLEHPTDSFDAVQQRYLSAHEGMYKLNQISPRCFEAIALKTVLVLYEGEYSGLLVPDRHYIMLKKDFSNIAHVLACLRDDQYLQRMADRAYDEVALNSTNSYQHFIEKCDQIISTEFQERSKLQVSSHYTKIAFKKVVLTISFKNRLNQSTRALYQKMPATIRTIIKFLYYNILKSSLHKKESR
ncbi:hypothetical protein N9Q05_01365 [bacterium]|nr:hypothetical protein [bacterium]